MLHIEKVWYTQCRLCGLVESLSFVVYSGIRLDQPAQGGKAGFVVIGAACSLANAFMSIVMRHALLLLD